MRRQFDVYQNPSQTTRKAYPFIVDIQSTIISDIATRIVIPLVRKSDFKNEALEKLTPIIDYEGEELLLLVPQIASVPESVLKNPIGSLRHLREEILAALDFAISGI